MREISDFGAPDDVWPTPITAGGFNYAGDTARSIPPKYVVRTET